MPIRHSWHWSGAVPAEPAGHWAVQVFSQQANRRRRKKECRIMDETEEKTRLVAGERKNNTELKPLRVGARRVLTDDVCLMKALAFCTTQSVVHLAIGVPIECSGMSETCEYRGKNGEEDHYSGHVHWVYFTSYMELGVVCAVQVSLGRLVVSLSWVSFCHGKIKQRDRAEAYLRTDRLWEWYELKVPQRNLQDCIAFLESQLGKPYHNLSCWYPFRLCFGQSYPWREKLTEVPETLSAGPPLNVPEQTHWNCVELVYAALIAVGVLHLGSDVPPVHTATAANVVDAVKRLYGRTETMRGMLAADFKRSSEEDDMEYYGVGQSDRRFTLL